MGDVPVAEDKDRLPPLPRRVGDEDPEPIAAGRSGEAVVAEMLERANQLLVTLESDVANLEADQKRDQERIAGETQRLRALAEEAVEHLAALTARALDIEHRKGRDGTIDSALRGPAPSIDDITFERVEQAIVEEIRLAKGITGAIRIESIAKMLRAATALVEKMISDAEASEALLMAQTDKILNKETVEATASFEIGAGVLERDLNSLDRWLPTSAVPWGDPRWSSWTPPGSPGGCIRLGTYTNPRLDGISIPVLFDLPGLGGILIDPGPRADDAITLLRSILVRIVAAFPPGAARFTVFDPRGLGEAVAPILPFTDAAPLLLEGGVRTTTEAIDEALDELGAHLERVIQHYLKGRFSTLAEASLAAGELLEPYRFVVILDHPQHLSPEGAERLATLSTHGPRCGVIPIIVKDPGYTPAYGTPRSPSLDAMFTITGDASGFTTVTERAGTWSVVPDAAPEITTTERVTVATAQDAATSHQLALDPARAFSLLDRAISLGVRRDLPAVPCAPDPDDSTTWWNTSGSKGAGAAAGVGVPLGRSGAVDLVTLWFDNIHRAALIIGGSDSQIGDVTDWVTSALTMIYPPDQVQLDLIGLGGSRKFVPHAEGSLPHANVVGIEADTELLCSSLDAVVREMDRRSTADPTNPVPHRVVVVDDPGRLIGTHSHGSQQLDTLLEKILRDGPDLGVNLIISTRDRGPGSIESLPLAWLTTRVLLPGASPETAGLLGVDAQDIASLQPGDAIVVSAGSTTPISRELRLAGIDAMARDRTIREVRRLAGTMKFTKTPQIFDSRAVARFERSPLAQFLSNTQGRDERRMPRLWLGEPMTLGGPVEMLMRRVDGANLLIVGDDEQLGEGTMLAAVMTAVLGQGRNLDVRVVDFMPLESGFTESVQAIGEHWPVKVERRRQFTKVLDEIHNMMQDRATMNVYRDPPVLFLLNGIGNARELDPGGRTSPDDAGDVGLDPRELINSIVHSGPEVGIHTIVWAESYDTVANRLGETAVSQFGARVVMPTDPRSSTALIDSVAASDLAPNQALFYDEIRGRLTRFRPYALATPEWVAGLAGAAAGI